MGIILKHRWHNLNFVWQKISRLRQRVETIMLANCIKKISKKKISWAFRKISQPRFIRRIAEKNKINKKTLEKHVNTGTLLLGMMIRKKKDIDYKEMEIVVAKYFNVWKNLANERNIPNFIMKRHYRCWSLKMLVNSLTYLHQKLKSSIFHTLNSQPKPANPNLFKIDKEIIENQAKIMVKLESQHFNKLREVKIVKRLEKLNKCKIIFWKHLKRCLMKWKETLQIPDNLEVFL